MTKRKNRTVQLMHQVRLARVLPVEPRGRSLLERTASRKLEARRTIGRKPRRHLKQLTAESRPSPSEQQSRAIFGLGLLV